VKETEAAGEEEEKGVKRSENSGKKQNNWNGTVGMYYLGGASGLICMYDGSLSAPSFPGPQNR
jgi:hypothetical protein